MRLNFYEKKSRHILLNLMLVLILILSISKTVWAANINVLPEISSSIQYQNVAPVSTEVLNAPTMDETLK